MAKKNEAKVEITADVKKFKDGINEAKSNLSALRTELSLNSAEFKANGDKAAFLNNKHEILCQMLEESNVKVKDYSKLLEEAKKAQDTASIEKYTKELNMAKSENIRLQVDIKKCTQEIEFNNSALGKLTNKVKDQENELKKLKSEYSNAVVEYGKNSNEAKNLSHQIENLSQSLSENKAELENARQSADKFDDTIEKLNNSAESASNGGFTVMKGAVASLVADGIKTAADEMKNFVVETDTANSVFQAQTGTSTEEMEKFNQAMINVYSNNFGEDMLDIANSMAQVKQQTKETDPSKLQELTEHAILLRDTFDMDIQESMRAVKMLMDQFGISGQEAFNLIVQGAQNGLDKNGDLLDSINEYSVHYKQQGYSAEQFFNSLLNGTEAGTFSVDKLGDAMKEFGIRTKDTADSTTEGFQLIGLNADYMRAEFAKGGESAQVATEKTLKALFSLKDEVKQNQAGVDLFGTMWEDLGIKGVEALMNTQGAISNNVDALSELNEVRYDNLTDFLASIQRQIESNIMPVINEVFPLIQTCIQEPLSNFADFTSYTIIPILSQTLTWMNEHRNLMLLIASVIAIITTAVIAYNAAQSISSAVSTAKTAANLAETASLWSLFAAQMAALAPYLLTVAVIAGVIAAIVFLIKHWNDLKNVATNSINWICKKVTEMKNSAIENFNDMKEKASSIGNGIKATVIGIINSIIGGVENGVNRVIRGINTMINGFNKIIGIGGAVLGIDVQIPNIKEISLRRVALAEGGIAFSPVQALIGEGGEPEAVAPISVLQRYIENSVESKLNTYMMIDYTRLAESMAAMQTIIELNSREVGRAIRS